MHANLCLVNNQKRPLLLDVQEIDDSPFTMLHKLLIAIAALFGFGASAQADTSKPTIDLNTPVENPSLVRAMNRLAVENSDAAKDSLLAELQLAHFLAAMLPGDNGKFPESSPGLTQLKKGTRFGVLSAGKDGKNYQIGRASCKERV